MFVGNKKLAILAAIVAIFGVFLTGPVDADGGLRIFDTEAETEVRRSFLFSLYIYRISR